MNIPDLPHGRIPRWRHAAGLRRLVRGVSVRGALPGDVGPNAERRPDHGALGPSRLIPVVLAAALALRAFTFVAYQHSPLAGTYVLDTLYYRTWALRIADGARLEAGVFEQSPLYAYLLGAVFRVCGPSELPAIAIQLLCGVATVLLLLAAARRLFGERAALVTGLLAAAYGPFLLHECLLTKGFLEPLFVTAAFWALVRYGDWHRARWAAAAGLAIGLAVLVREVHAILLVPAAFALVRRGSGCAVRLRLAGVAVLLLVFAATVLPVTARNYLRSGDLTLVTAAGGENMYLAYGPEAGEFYPPLPFVTAVPHREHEDFREEASLRAGRTLGRGQASEFWYRETLSTVLADPAGAAGRAMRKVKVLFQDFEVPDSEDFSVAREHLPLLRVLPTFGWIFGIGLVGLFGPVRRLRSRLPLIWLLAFLALEVALTFNLARYRLAMVAIWLIPSGAGAAWLWEAAVQRGSGARRAAAALVFVAAATAFSYQAPPRSYPLHLSVANQRVRIGKARQRTAALPALLAAAAAEPWNPERQMELAGVLRNLGRIPEAMAAYEKILRANPTHFAARWELASTLVEQGWLDETIGHLRVLTRQSPASASAHYFLGRFLSRIAARSDPAAARTYEEEAGLHLQAALGLDAAHAPSWYEIGRRRHLRGDAQGAVEALNRAVRLAPGLGEAVRLLNIINARNGGMVDGIIPGQGSGAASWLMT